MTTTFATPPAPPVPPAPPAPPSGPSAGPGRAVALAAAGLLTVGTIGWGVWSLADMTAKTSNEMSFESAVVDRLEVDTDGSVTVRAGSPGEATNVTRRVQYGLLEPTFDDDVSTVDGSDVLRLRGDCPTMAGVWCRVDYTVTIDPEASVQVVTSHGSLSISGIDGDVEVTSDAGSVTLADLGGAVTVDAGAGFIRAEDLRSTRVSARSDAGSVRRFFDVAPEAVSARAGAGRVEVVLPDDGAVYLVDIATDAGSTTVAVPTDPDSTRAITARSDAGDVSVHHPD